MDRCPACGSSRIYPSRLRSTSERLRRLFTGMQPYRCHQCDVRRWGRVAVRIPDRGGETSPDELRVRTPQTSLAPADLDRLDPK